MKKMISKRILRSTFNILHKTTYSTMLSRATKLHTTQQELPRATGNSCYCTPVCGRSNGKMERMQ